MQVVQEAPQAFISQLIPGETARQKNSVANQSSAFGTGCPGRRVVSPSLEIFKAWLDRVLRNLI